MAVHSRSSKSWVAVTIVLCVRQLRPFLFPSGHFQTTFPFQPPKRDCYSFLTIMMLYLKGRKYTLRNVRSFSSLRIERCMETLECESRYALTVGTIWKKSLRAAGFRVGRLLGNLPIKCPWISWKWECVNRFQLVFLRWVDSWFACQSVVSQSRLAGEILLVTLSSVRRVTIFRFHFCILRAWSSFWFFPS